MTLRRCAGVAAVVLGLWGAWRVGRRCAVPAAAAVVAARAMPGDWLDDTIGAAAGLLGLVLRPVIGFARRVLRTVWGRVYDLAMAVHRWGVTAVRDLWGHAHWLYRVIVDHVARGVQAAVTWSWRTITDWVWQRIQEVRGALTWAIEQVRGWAEAAIAAVNGALTWGIEQVRRGAEAAVAAAGRFLGALIAQVVHRVDWVIDQVGRWIGDALRPVRAWVEVLIDRVRDWVTDRIDQVRRWLLDNVIAWVWERIEDRLRALERAAELLARRLMGMAWRIVSDAADDLDRIMGRALE